MQPTCDRCGGTLSVPEATAPGAPARVTCSCGHTSTIRAPGAAPRTGTRDAGPLPSPRGGHFEVDPWSLPPPEGGYESLVLDEGQPGAAEAAPAAAPAETAGSIATALEGVEPAAEASPEDALAVAPAPGRSRAILAAAALAALLVVAGFAAWLARSRPPTPAAAGGAVRVTVTQEIPWSSPPPLAPLDPTFAERARAEAPPSRPATLASPSPRPPASPAPPARAPAARPAPELVPAGAVDARPPADALPPAPETGAAAPAAPDPAPGPGPAAPAASAAIPLPPAPPPPAAQAAPARDAGPAAKGRAPVLQTASCVEDALRIPRGLEARLPREVILRVEVGEDGRPANVTLPGSVDPRLGSALAAAVRKCRFEPGSDATGRPAALPTTMRVRFEP
jgi:TonB family protein